MSVCAQCKQKQNTTEWEKVLYKKQPFPDSYVDEHFLTSLVTQEKTKKYNFWALVDNTSEITYAINTMILFLFWFQVAYNQELAEPILILFEYSFLTVGLLIYIYLQSLKLPQIRSSMRTGVILVATLYILSPVLKTINSNYADDTIFLMTFTFWVLYLLFYDYSFVNSSAPVPNVTSLTCALISALLLSSRLNSSNYVYFTLSLAFM